MLVSASKAFGSQTYVRQSGPGDTSRLQYRQRLTDRLRDAGGGAFDEDFAFDLLDQANRFRRSAGLVNYQWDEGLAATARAHAADMANRNYFDHYSPEGFSHLDRVSLLMRDLCGSTVENLVWRGNDPANQTPARFERMWEDSDGHRRNLLRGSFTSAGYGVVRIGRRYYAAGVYAEASLRLAEPLPLTVTDGRQISRSLDNAAPEARRFALTAPFCDPTWTRACNEQAPPLASGVWQLRPLVAKPGHYDVLPGPTFFVN